MITATRLTPTERLVLLEVMKEFRDNTDTSHTFQFDCKENPFDVLNSLIEQVEGSKEDRFAAYERERARIRAELGIDEYGNSIVEKGH